MKLSTNVSIHNRFDIYINDKQVAYGDSKYQKGMAENIVLDQMYNRLCARTSYFANIHFGTGTGTLAASRTSLFTHLGTKTAVNDAQSKVFPTSYWRQKIVLNPEEYVGSALSEVGVAYGATSSYLVTHALIKDMNGNPITLTKTALDVVTIYATIYVTFSTTNSQIGFGSPAINSLMDFLIGGTAWPSLYFYASKSNAPLVNNQRIPTSHSPLGTSSALTWTTDVANKKTYSNTYRFAIDAANGHIRELAIGESTTKGMFRLLLPATGVYAGLDLSAVPLGTGDGSTTKFYLPSLWAKQSSIKAYKDSVEDTGITKTQVACLTHLSNIPVTNINASDHYVCGDYLVACSASSSWFSIYKLTDGQWVFQESVNVGRQISATTISSDGLVVGYGTGTYLSSEAGYGVSRKINGVWTHQFLMSGTTYAGSCIVSPDGSKVSGQVYTDQGRIYNWNGSSYVQVNTGLPKVLGFFSSDGSVMLITDANSQIIYRYTWNGSTFVTSYNTGNLGHNIMGYCMPYLNCNSDMSKVLYVTSQSPWMRLLEWSGSAYVAATDVPTIGTPESNNMYYAACKWDKTQFFIYPNRTTCKMYTKVGSDWKESTIDVDSSSSEFSGNIENNNLTYRASPSGNLQKVNIDNALTLITFPTAPANGVVLTADYTVDGIHKTAQRVIDLYAEIVFGEVT